MARYAKEIQYKENWIPAKIAGLNSPCRECISHKPSQGGYIVIRRNGIPSRLHHVAFIKRHGEIPLGKIVRHKCDNPPCDNVDHLIIGTHKDNSNDREIRLRGNHPNGEKHGRAKLNITQVREIFHNSKISYDALARQYNVSKGAIQGIKNGSNWKNIKK